MRTIAHSLACILLVAMVGCASWLMKGEPPEVLVTNITPLEGTAFEQRLQVDLRIRNPNAFDLLVTGIDFDFTLNLNGKRLARGLGNTGITIPRLSEAVVSVQTSTSTFDVVRQLLTFSQAQDLSYDITGRLHLKDGRLPFDNSGILLEKGQLSGVPSP
jgi:LEA14-like dessication related protein